MSGELGADATTKSFRLFVDLAPVCNPRHSDGFGGVVNFVDDAVVSYANTPFAVATLQFLAARRPGVVARCSRRGIIRATSVEGSRCSSPAALAVKDMR